MCKYPCVRRKDWRDGKIGYKHQYVWEMANGPIPGGYEVHHINMDHFDNRLENLKLLTIEEHQLVHGKK